jgi:beta-lactamase class D
MTWRCFALGLLAAGLAAQAAEARTVCTALAEAATGKILEQHGDCSRRVTAASTFKIAISLMGYDSGFLKDEHSPALPFRKGYPDWRPVWRQTTDPTGWIKYSVVWFSQQVTRSLGEARFQAYVAKFHYGNEDVSGDPGKHDGLTHAWLSASLKISPLEQLAFLEKLVNRQLPVAPRAIDMTSRITAITVLPAGWEIHGKTGTGAPRTPEGAYDRAHSYGWFVGWATKDGRTIVFARLIQDEAMAADPAGPRARDALLKELPALLAGPAAARGPAR